MKPAVVVSVLAALAAAITIGGTNLRSTPRVAPAPRPSATLPVAKSLCPRGTLPDEGVCIPVPAPAGTPAPLANTERIPLLTNRDADHTHYALPVATDRTSVTVSDARSALTDGGPLLDGIFVQVAPHTPVTAVTLDGQEGPALAVYAGPFVGATLVSYHVTRIANRRREYVVVTGNLDEAAPFAPRATVASGTVVGKVAPTPLYFAVRLVRAGTDVWGLSPKQLLDDASSIAVDPRNVLAAAASR